MADNINSYNLFGTEDETLMAAEEARKFQMAQALSQGYKRPGRATIGALLGGAVAGGFGFQSPQQQELAKRAALKQAMNKTGIDPAKDPETYLRTFASFATKMGMDTYAARAMDRMEGMKKYREERDLKLRELSDAEERTDAMKANFESEAAYREYMQGADEAKTSFKPAVDDPVWGPKVRAWPEEIRNSAQVNKRGELQILLRPSGDGSDSGNDGGANDEVQARDVTPEDLVLGANMMQQRPQVWKGITEEKWFSGNKLTPGGKAAMTQVMNMGRTLSANNKTWSLGDATLKVVDAIEAFRGQMGGKYSFAQAASMLQVLEPAEAARLKPGTPFITTDGRLMRKS